MILIETPCIEASRPRAEQKRDGVRKACYIWAAEDWYGPVPEGKQVNHHCDNPKCYNVEHLYIGTQADNMRDRKERGRWKGGAPRRTHCKRGHAFVEENIYHYKGQRLCRTCRREHQ